MRRRRRQRRAGRRLGRLAGQEGRVRRRLRARAGLERARARARDVAVRVGHVEEAPARSQVARGIGADALPVAVARGTGGAVEPDRVAANVVGAAAWDSGHASDFVVASAARCVERLALGLHRQDLQALR